MQTQIKKPKNLLFIHSLVDDAGLTPNEFRLVCHFARRGVCFSTLAKIAEITDMSVRTIQKTLKFLVEEGLVLKETHPGRSDVYRLPDPDTFIEKLHSGKIRERKELKKKEQELNKQEENSRDETIFED